MAHLHPVYDDDPHFSINSSSREITYQSNEKLIIIQGDHNSERYTFEIPKTVDGHDMTLCDLVQVHYINIDSSNSRERNTGLYKVDDVQVSPDDEDTLVFSWLISQNATKLVGSLNFVVRFACTSGSKIDYSWSTSVFSSVTIATSIDNAGLVVEQYADVLESWYMELLSAGTMGVDIVTDTANKAIENINGLVESAKTYSANASTSATNSENSATSAATSAAAAAASAEAAANFNVPIHKDSAANSWSQNNAVEEDTELTNFTNTLVRLANDGGMGQSKYSDYVDPVLYDKDTLKTTIENDGKNSVMMNGYSHNKGATASIANRRPISAGNPYYGTASMSFVSGKRNINIGDHNTITGTDNITMGDNVFMSGLRNIALENETTTFGFGNISTGLGQFVCGRYNIPDSTKAFIVGGGWEQRSTVNGKLTVTSLTRRNLFTIDGVDSTHYGDAQFYGKVTAGDRTPDKNSNDLARMKDVVAKSDPVGTGVEKAYIISNATNSIMTISSNSGSWTIPKRNGNSTFNVGVSSKTLSSYEDLNAVPKKAIVDYVDSKLGSGTYADAAGKIVGSDGTANYTVLSTRYYEFTAGGTNYKYLYVEPNNTQWGKNVILGSNDNYLNAVYASNFIGKLKGIAENATRAYALTIDNGTTVGKPVIYCDDDTDYAYILPSVDVWGEGKVRLGHSSNKFDAVYATSFIGKATSANKADTATTATSANKADTATTATTATTANTIKIGNTSYKLTLDGTTLSLTAT